MRYRLSAGLLLTGLFLLAGCAGSSGELSPQTPRPVFTEMRTPQGSIVATWRVDSDGYQAVLRVPAAEVWEALPDIFDSFGIDAGVLSESPQTFGNPSLHVRRRLAGERLSAFVSCGLVPAGGPAADTYLLELSIYSQVSSRDAQTANLQIVISGYGTAPGGNARTACASTGVLEERIVAALQARLDNPAL